MHTKSDDLLIGGRAMRHVALAALVAIVAACGADAPVATSGAAEGGEDATEELKLDRPRLYAGGELAAIQVLHRGNGAEPQSLDPHKADGVPSSHVLRDLFEGLTSEATNGEVIPGAANAWRISDDGTVYTFHIRETARWSNGDRVTAYDFVFGLQRSVDPATLSKYSQILAPIKNAEAVIAGELPADQLGVRATDDATLEITLRSPTPYFLGVLNHSSSYPVHRASVEQHGNRFARPGVLVSNGAYQLDQWVVQSHIHLVRNRHFWDDANTHIDEVYFYPIENQSTELKRYRAGELAWTFELPYKQLTWIRENLGDQLLITPWLGSYYFGFNMTRPPFGDNPDLRKALAMAIDREILVENVTGAGEIAAYGWVPPVINYTGQRVEWADLTRDERLTEARRLYSKAGYSPDNPLRTSIMYNTHENHKRISVAIAAMLKQNLGVEIELLNQEWKVFLQTRRQKTETQIFRAGWIGDYNDPYNFAELMLSSHGLNDPGYNNPVYDDLLARATVEGDPAVRRQLLEEAERVLLTDLPLMPLYFYVTKRLVQPWVAGWEPNIMDHHYTKNLVILAH